MEILRQRTLCVCCNNLCFHCDAITSSANRAVDERRRRRRNLSRRDTKVDERRNKVQSNRMQLRSLGGFVARNVLVTDARDSHSTRSSTQKKEKKTVRTNETQKLSLILVCGDCRATEILCNCIRRMFISVSIRSSLSSCRRQPPASLSTRSTRLS